MALIGSTSPAMAVSDILTDAAGGGDEFVNTGKEMYFVFNGSGAPITVTFDMVYVKDTGVMPDVAFAVAAGKASLFGPFQKNHYNDGDNHVNVTYSGVTSLEVAVIRGP